MAPNDPELCLLDAGYTVPNRATPTEVKVYVMRERMSVALGRTKWVWFGIAEGVTGPALSIGMLFVLHAWDQDPLAIMANKLRAELALKNLVDRVFP